MGHGLQRHHQFAVADDPSLPLHVTTLEVRFSPLLTIFSSLSRSRLILRANQDPGQEYGSFTWPSAVLLARFLSNFPELVRSKRVIEVTRMAVLAHVGRV
jgi:predicted nicotinamide N-methyase